MESQLIYIAYFRLLLGVVIIGFQLLPGFEVGGSDLLSGTVA